MQVAHECVQCELTPDVLRPLGLGSHRFSHIGDRTAAAGVETAAGPDSPGIRPQNGRGAGRSPAVRVMVAVVDAAADVNGLGMRLPLAQEVPGSVAQLGHGGGLFPVVQELFGLPAVVMRTARKSCV